MNNDKTENIITEEAKQSNNSGEKELTEEALYSQKRDVSQSYWSLVKHQFKKSKLAVMGFYIVIVLIVVAVFADFLANNEPIYAKYNGTVYLPVFKEYLIGLGLSKWSGDMLNFEWKSANLESAIWPPIHYRPGDVDLMNTLSNPSFSSGHFLGTDGIGRDVLSGLIHGSRVSLSVGFVAAGISVLIGLILGAFAGFYGGTVDIIIMRFVEIMILFPSFFLIITIVALYGSSIWFIMIAIGLTSWTGNARLTRGEVLKVRNMDYVSAATSLGLTNRRIIFRHILPNAVAPVLVSGAFDVAGAILVEAALSFLGFGVAATTVTWGSVLSEARGATESWWLAVFPGFMIFITVVAYNLVGEGLRDALDPRLRD